MRKAFLAAALVVAALAVRPSPAASVLVWPMGDSITDGVTFSAASTPGGYRGFLDLLLTASGRAHQFVGTAIDNSSPVLDAEGQNHHEGHSGYRIEQDDADIDGVAGAWSDNGGHWMTGLGGRAPILPDVVVVHLGTNDILQDFDPQTVFPTSNGKANVGDPAQVSTFVADMTARLKHLVDKISSLHPGTRFVVSNVVPIGTGFVDTVTPVYSAALASFVRAEHAAGIVAVFADVWSPFVASTPAGTVIIPGLLSPDSVHPTAAGYALMAEIYADAIARLYG